MTYKFEQFNVEITNPTIVVVNVNDFINDKTCSVEIQLVTENAIFGVTLNGFTYEITWDDDEIKAWVEIELEKYEV
jgi:hypothetical protein